MFDKLKPLLENNEEGLKILGELESAQSQLTSKLNALEVDAKKAFETRDGVKAQLRLVKEKLGVDEISDEALEKVLKGKKGDDTEINNLKTLLEKANKEKEEEISKYQSKLNDYVMRSELTKTGLAQKALNPELYQILESIALQGATVGEDGAIVFRNPDGSTKYSNGGKPMTLAERVTELENSESYAPMFKAESKNGTAGKNGATTNKAPSEYSEQERIELFKTNPARFNQIFG
jgi:hypothetical protein